MAIAAQLEHCSHCGVAFVAERVDQFCSPDCQRAGTVAVTAHRPGVGRMLRYGTALLLTGQAMTLGLAVNLSPPDPPAAFALRVVGMVLALLVAALMGSPLLIQSARALRAGRVTVELLFLLSAAGAFAASVQATWLGVGDVYFEVVAVVLLVYGIGQEIGHGQRATAQAGARAWLEPLSRCRRVSDEGVTDVAVETILPGEVVEVRPGDAVPVDGVIERGVGFVEAAAVTGEPFATVRRAGDEVCAGTVSRDGAFRIRATTAGSERQIDRIAEAVAAAEQTPTVWQRRADRLASRFVPTVAMAATVAWALGTAAGGWAVGTYRAMSVLLVACPCALGLATPLAVWSALTAMARRGLVSQRGDFVERLAAIDCVVLDKTGTLTEERFVLQDLVTAPGWDRERVRHLMACVEAASDHPVATAFAGRFPAGLELLTMRVVPACGVEAVVREAGGRRTLRIGRPTWLAGNATLADRLLVDGHRIDLEVDGRLVACAVVGERLRSTTAEALAELEAMGIPVRVLTGDNRERAVALGLPDAEGLLTPDAKRERIAAMVCADGRPLFIGDGINDAAAMTAATASIAMASGTALAQRTATATLHGGDLRAIPAALRASREARDIIDRAIGRAVAYNAAGMALAILGFLHPVVAALLMAGSSLLAAGTGVSASCLACVPAATPTWWQTAVHGGALFMQGILLAALWDVSSLPALSITLAVAIGLPLAWSRWTASPRWDMAFGMASLGGLGMALGAWYDAGFHALPPDCGCGCGGLTTYGGPGLWLGMFAASQVAMLGLRRAGEPCSGWSLALGNVGMAVGMIAGHRVLAAFGVDAPGWHWPAMLAGMALGMDIGHTLARRLDTGLARAI